MSRLIKFRYRFKHPTTGAIMTEIFDLEEIEDGLYSWSACEILSREQYTGLQDKNGKQIYEGDILKTDEAGWVAWVTWKRARFWLTDSVGGFCVEPYWEKCEVLGNIYENPELLKER